MLYVNHTPYTPLILSSQGRMRSDGGVGRDDETDAITNKRLRILIVDDTLKFRTALSFMLNEKYGAEVTHVGSGVEAVEAVRAGGVFDLVLLDIRMWPMNGIATYRALMSIDPACHVVMMSAHANNEDWEEAENLGIELFHKPIPEATMTLILSRVGSRRP